MESREMRGIRLRMIGIALCLALLCGAAFAGDEKEQNAQSNAGDLQSFSPVRYLAYNSETKTVHIPNEEIRLEFARTIREDKNTETMKRVQESDRLIMNTIHRNAEAVATQIEKVHLEATNPLNANNENALRAVIQLAYFSYRDYYIKMEELPTGRGYADIVYLPKQGETVPALVIELKWNQSADTAIEQIRQRRYPEVLREYGGEILLVGINYDREAPAGQRKYTCIIEQWQG